MSCETTGEIIQKILKNERQCFLLKCIEVVLHVKKQELDMHLSWYGISLMLDW